MGLVQPTGPQVFLMLPEFKSAAPAGILALPSSAAKLHEQVKVNPQVNRQSIPVRSPNPGLQTDRGKPVLMSDTNQTVTLTGQLQTVRARPAPHPSAYSPVMFPYALRSATRYGRV